MDSRNNRRRGKEQGERLREMSTRPRRFDNRLPSQACEFGHGDNAAGRRARCRVEVLWTACESKLIGTGIIEDRRSVEAPRCVAANSKSQSSRELSSRKFRHPCRR
jgi:hypothetical protein